MGRPRAHLARGWSLSARRAWIEIIGVKPLASDQRGVALRKESVDRNEECAGSRVVLHEVALRKESVDRNIMHMRQSTATEKSLSARRAWIEIPSRYRNRQSHLVALRKESVDRNALQDRSIDYGKASLSARRAWIEMPQAVPAATPRAVALRKESVDRNWQRATAATWARRRSPQGERG